MSKNSGLSEDLVFVVAWKSEKEGGSRREWPIVSNMTESLSREVILNLQGGHYC